MSKRTRGAESSIPAQPSNEVASNGRVRRRPAKRDVWPRGLRRLDAADYAGISPTLYDEWVKQRMLPATKKIGGVVLTDRFALDDALDVLFASESEEQLDAWNDVRV
jgi:hypothetical protein